MRREAFEPRDTFPNNYKTNHLFWKWMKKCLEIISLWLPVIRRLPIKSKYLEGVLVQQRNNNGSFLVFPNSFLSQKESIDTLYSLLNSNGTEHNEWNHSRATHSWPKRNGGANFKDTVYLPYWHFNWKYWCSKMFSIHLLRKSQVK